jgi:hypothetical protein
MRLHDDLGNTAAKAARMTLQRGRGGKKRGVNERDGRRVGREVSAW